MPKINKDGPTHGIASADVVETDDPAVQREIDARESRAHAGENVTLRRERDALQKQVDDLTLAAAERDGKADKAAAKSADNDAEQDGQSDGPKPSKVAAGASKTDATDTKSSASK